MVSVNAMEPSDWLDYSFYCNHAASLAMIFGGVLPYLPQYLEIRRTNDCEGFSTTVCLVLLVANILRIVFWFGDPFEYTLLIQSVVMIIAMMAMMDLCVRVKAANLIIVTKNKYFLDFKWKYFWDWTDFVSYLEFLATFTFLSSLAMYCFIDIPVFVEATGFIALVTEALLASPQLVKNFRLKSTVGLSQKMVILWTIGDMFKTIYFIVKKVQFQFLVCGIIQITIDLLIGLQIFAYRQRRYHDH